MKCGCDLVEVTAHSGARPEHAEWQGKVYSRSGKSSKYPSLVEATGYGTGPGLGGWNCRHSMFPYYEGMSRVYIDEELEDLKNTPKDDIILLPNLKNAVIPKEKLLNYALDKNHPKGKEKAKAFEIALGYNIENYQDLIGNIMRNIDKFPAKLKGENEYGQKYEVLMTIIGNDNKKANIKTAWLVDKNTNETRLTTLYVTSKKYKKDGE